MITLKSDFSPQNASEQQEEENTRMIEMLLFMAGMDVNDLQYFVAVSHKTARDYLEALGDDGNFEAAKDAARHGMTELGRMLSHHGITITNILRAASTEGYFAHIETLVYADYGKMELVGRIERPIVDNEAKTYENNSSGFECNLNSLKAPTVEVIH